MEPNIEDTPLERQGPVKTEKDRRNTNIKETPDHEYSATVETPVQRHISIKDTPDEEYSATVGTPIQRNISEKETSDYEYSATAETYEREESKEVSAPIRSKSSEKSKGPRKESPTSKKSKAKGEKSKKKSSKAKKTSESVDVTEQGLSKTPTKDSEDLSESRISKSRQSKMDTDRQSTYAKRRPPSKSVTAQSHSSVVSNVSAVTLDQDIVTLTVPETTQKIVHCLIGKDLFVDKTWCMVKKKDLLEDIAIEDANSPFVPLTTKILDYKEEELLIGYEPFASEPNQFMLCVTETGRDEVLNKLEEMKNTYLQRIQQSKAVKPKKWESLGSEEFVNQFQIKNTRKLISMEWIGDITKRCQYPRFEDCDPDDMKNGYTCLVPSDKEKFELVYRKTQETGIQAVASKAEAEVQTDPEIPTNASTQYAPETEIVVSDTTVTQAAISSHNLDEFFKKYMDYLLECLQYNEVYDLYQDDYPALYVQGEETQVQQLGVYHQYQSFTDMFLVVPQPTGVSTVQRGV